MPGIPGWHISRGIPASTLGFNAWILANRYDNSIVLALWPSGAEQPLELEFDPLFYELHHKNLN